jgi:predicted lipoprotein with Yx(FWY)xxD motif
MRTKIIVGAALAGSALLAACGGGTGYKAAAPAASATKTTSTTTAVKVGHSQLGDILVNGAGRTLYGFTNDTNGTSSCNGACAQSWPALTVKAGWTTGAGVKRATFHTVARAGGQLQLATGKWPLYTFAGDRAPGDVNGQGSLGKWFVVRPDGSLMMGTSSAGGSSSSSSAMSAGGGY